MKYLVPILFFLSPLSAAAAVLSTSASPQAIGVGNVVQIAIDVSSEESVNAYSGKLIYPKDLVEPLLMTDGNSIVPLWIDRPKETALGISFSGITPLGFAGKNGRVFSVIFRAKAAGVATFQIKDAVVLLNDYAGSPASTTVRSAVVSIESGFGDTYILEQDTKPPEPFSLTLDTGPDGKNYLLFSTVDKGSGIARYEVAQKRFAKDPDLWLPAESPYLLVDQELTSDIRVRAIDSMGNHIESSLARTQILTTKERFAFCIVLVLFVLLLLLVRAHRKRSARIRTLNI